MGVIAASTFLNLPRENRDVGILAAVPRGQHGTKESARGSRATDYEIASFRACSQFAAIRDGRHGIADIAATLNWSALQVSCILQKMGLKAKGKT